MRELLSAADIERLAADMGISLAELARRAGVSPTTITRWRAGETEPTLAVYKRIVSALPPSRRSRRPANPAARHWALQDAKSRFSELVRRARSDGPQYVTVHGRSEIVIVASEEFRRMAGEQTGQALIEAMQSCPDREVDLAPERPVLPTRDVVL